MVTRNFFTGWPRRDITDCPVYSILIRSPLLTSLIILASIAGVESLSVEGRVAASDYVMTRWGQFLRPIEGEHLDANTALKAELNQMLSWFRKHGAKHYAVYGKRFHTVILRKGQDKKAIELEGFLRSEGILDDDGSMVVLDQDRLSAFDVYYVKQNELNFGPRFSDLVGRWVQHKRHVK